MSNAYAINRNVLYETITNPVGKLKVYRDRKVPVGTSTQITIKSITVTIKHSCPSWRLLNCVLGLFVFTCKRMLSNFKIFSPSEQEDYNVNTW